MQAPFKSQQLRRLEATIRHIKLSDEQEELTASFSAFHQWLKTSHSEIYDQAQEIARDVRLWRDTEDVLRQVWEQIYGR